MSKRNMTGFLIFMVILFASFSVTQYFQSQAQQKHIDRIEHTLSIQKTVKFPCAGGREVDCRAFLAILLNRATTHQLVQILKARKLHFNNKDAQAFLQHLNRENQLQLKRRVIARRKISGIFGPLTSVAIGSRKGVRPGTNQIKPKGLPGRRRVAPSTKRNKLRH